MKATILLLHYTGIFQINAFFISYLIVSGQFDDAEEDDNVGVAVIPDTEGKLNHFYVEPDRK